DEVLAAESRASETANRESGPVQRDRWERCVHAAPIGEPSIEHGRRHVDPAANARCDPLYDTDEVVAVPEADRGLLKPTVTLDVDLVVRVDEDIAHGGVGEER